MECEKLETDTKFWEKEVGK